MWQENKDYFLFVFEDNPEERMLNERTPLLKQKGNQDDIENEEKSSTMSATINLAISLMDGSLAIIPGP